MRVEVYWNVRRRLYSVRALEGPDRGRVVARLPGLERLAREATQVTYDPYLDDHFRDDRGARVERADEVWLRTDLRGGKARAQVLAFGVS